MESLQIIISIIYSETAIGEHYIYLTKIQVQSREVMDLRINKKKKTPQDNHQNKELTNITTLHILTTIQPVYY